MEEIIDLLLDENKDSLYVFRRLKEYQNEIFRKWDEEDAKERAISEGIQKGIEKTTIGNIERMLKMEMSIDKIAMLLGLTTDEVNEYISRLNSDKEET